MNYKIYALLIALCFKSLLAAAYWNKNQGIIDVEERIVLNCRTSADFTFRQNAVQSLTDNVQAHTQQFIAPIINWETQKLSVILSSMFWIQDRKLRNRATGVYNSSYVTKYERGAALLRGVESDPYPMYFQFDGIRYKLSLNYNGSPYTHQPGNYYLMKDIPQRSAMSFDKNITIDQYNSKEYQLHLLGEILRRKAVDPYRNDLVDEFSSIPVATGIVMATKLIRGGQDVDVLNRFWKTGGAHHLFSSTYEVRRDNFDALTERYLARYGIAPDNTELMKRTLNLHAAEVFGYEDFEDAIGSLFV